MYSSVHKQFIFKCPDQTQASLPGQLQLVYLTSEINQLLLYAMPFLDMIALKHDGEKGYIMVAFVLCHISVWSCLL